MSYKLIGSGIVAVLALLLMAMQSEEKPTRPVLVLHGGAGTILKANMSPELEKAYREKLEEALQKGYALLESGASALDAVEQSIHILEDSPLFNAGKGAVLNHLGNQEMDASIMDGRNLNAGAVAGVSSIRNPISAARLVMEKSKHVMLSGKGAEEFCKQQNLQFEQPSYFKTEKRIQQLKRAKDREKTSKDQGYRPLEEHEKFGTVGVVALDKNGNLAAGTSTGGMTNKRFGRIGDSPIIAAGTYANNQTCAVSCTGHGEYFIRNVVAYDLSAMMEYKNYSLKKASNKIIHQKLKKMNASGGLIALDKKGNIAMPFNTAGMYRGYAKDGIFNVFIYQDEN